MNDDRLAITAAKAMTIDASSKTIVNLSYESYEAQCSYFVLCRTAFSNLSSFAADTIIIPVEMRGMS